MNERDCWIVAVVRICAVLMSPTADEPPTDVSVESGVQHRQSSEDSVDENESIEKGALLMEGRGHSSQSENTNVLIESFAVVLAVLLQDLFRDALVLLTGCSFQTSFEWCFEEVLRGLHRHINSYLPDLIGYSFV